jgi:hypothetical protein
MPDEKVEFTGERKKPYRIGTTRVIDARTGEVVEEKRNAMTLLPCKPGVCQECAVDHPFDMPHNQQSMYYQMQFHAKHGRWPTWSDAMAHTSPEVRAKWRVHLVAQLEKHGMEVPDDLKGDGPNGR